MNNEYLAYVVLINYFLILQNTIYYPIYNQMFYIFAISKVSNLNYNEVHFFKFKFQFKI